MAWPREAFSCYLNYFHILQNYEEEITSLIKSFSLHFKLPNWENISLCHIFKGKGKISQKKTDNLLDQTLFKKG